MTNTIHAKKTDVIQTMNPADNIFIVRIFGVEGGEGGTSSNLELQKYDVNPYCSDSIKNLFKESMKNPDLFDNHDRGKLRELSKTKKILLKLADSDAN